MHEQPAPPHFMMPKRLIHEPMVRVCLCLFLALMCGLVLGFLQVRAQDTTYDPWLNGTWAVPLWFPFVLGIAAAILTVRVVRQPSYRFWLSVAVGLLTWIGIASWWFPIADSEDAAFNASCLHRYCHVSGLEGVGLLFYLLFGMVLVLLGTLVTSLLFRVLRQ
jgi:hypothetical protein